MKSMTGFAQGRFEFSNMSLHILFRSWNHRFLDIYFKGTGITPETEKLIKEVIKDRVSRGKIEIVFDCQSKTFDFDILSGQAIINRNRF